MIAPKIKQWDLVLYSPFIYCDDQDKQTLVATSDSFFSSAWEEVVFLEWKSGFSSCENCEKMTHNFKIWDVVYYTPFPWCQEKERWVVSSFCQDKNFIFVRFKSMCWERTSINQLSK